MKLKTFFIGEGRTLKAKKNIIVSALFKGGDTFIYLFLVPLTLGYLDPYEYGIWLTLNSILSWINSFDVGLGSGLRNKLAEAIAKDDIELARKYVSTTLFSLGILAILIVIIGLTSFSFLNFYRLLNVDPEIVKNLDEIIKVSFLLFCANFVFKFVGNVYQALQIPSAMYVFNFLGHLLALVIIFILTKTTTSNLLLVAIVYSASSPIVYLIAYPITFNILYKYLRPTAYYFDFSCVKELLSLSLTFFIMQLSSLVLFSLSNILISNMFGPAEVTPVNIAQRYFSILPMIVNVLLSPVWSATTDAYIREDFNWIQKANRKIEQLILIMMMVFPLLVWISPWVYNLWIGHDVTIPIWISILSAIYNFLFIWSLCYSVILNGIGKLKIQMIFGVAGVVVFIPLCNYLGHKVGVIGILISMCLITMPVAISNTIQYRGIIFKKLKNQG